MIVQLQTSVAIDFALCPLSSIAMTLGEACRLYLFRKHEKYTSFSLCGGSLETGDVGVLRLQLNLNIPQGSTTFLYACDRRVNIPTTGPLHSAAPLPRFTASRSWPSHMHTAVSALSSSYINTGAMTKERLIG